MRVITLDLRGNGKSDRPEGGYDLDTYVEDVHTVIQAARLERFAMAGHSLGVSIIIKYNALHPGRVSHLILISGAAKMVQSEDYPKGMPKEMLDGAVQFWEAQPEVMLKSFIEMLCTEKYSLRFKELIRDWAHETVPELWSRCFSVSCFADVDDYLKNIDIPCLIIHGTRDKIIHPSASQYLNKKIAGSSTFLVPDAGHIFAHTWPQVSRQIFTFLNPESPLLSPPSQKMTGHKILWISSPIGLGHVKRDLAILSAIREKMPDLIVHWLCVDPVRSYLTSMGEIIHPMSDFLMDESKHFENNATAYALNATEAYWDMDRILNNNFMVFTDAVRSDGYDLVVGDESWDVHEYLHYNPPLKTTPFVFLTDFVGASNVSDGEVRQAHVANVNGSWIEMRRINPGASDLSIFIGEPEDIPDRVFGEGLPNIREWTKSLFSFSGYILPFDPRDYDNRQMIRRELGFSPSDKILLVAVGGTSVGRPLIEKCLAAQEKVREIIPDLHSIFLCGPRIDSQSFGHAEGVEFRSFVPDPVKLYASCDLAVIQGGLSTAMELTALARPFLYFPLKDHFEQQDYVDYRLKNYRAGVRMDFDHTSISQLAEAIAAHIGDSANYKPVPVDGANKVASMITGLLGISE